MQNTSDKYALFFTITRWVARIGSMVSVGMLLLFIFGEGFDPGQLTLRLRIMFLFFPIGVMLGLVLAWRWEVVGGTIAIASLLAFYLFHFLTNSRFPGGPYFAILTAPALLFLIAGMQARFSPHLPQAG